MGLRRFGRTSTIAAVPSPGSFRFDSRCRGRVPVIFLRDQGAFTLPSN
jgi:hypothetical protein